jgi:hypothetical protein
MKVYVVREQASDHRRRWVAFDFKAKTVVKSWGSKADTIADFERATGEKVTEVVRYKGFMHPALLALTILDHRQGQIIG